MQYVKAQVTVTLDAIVAIENDDVDTSTIESDIKDAIYDALPDYIGEFVLATPCEVDGETVDGADVTVPIGMKKVDCESGNVTIHDVQELEASEVG